MTVRVVSTVEDSISATFTYAATQDHLLILRNGAWVVQDATAVSFATAVNTVSLTVDGTLFSGVASGHGVQLPTDSFVTVGGDGAIRGYGNNGFATLLMGTELGPGQFNSARLRNAGEITAIVGDAVRMVGFGTQVENTGLISGGSGGVRFTDGLSTLVNSGTISATFGAAVHGGNGLFMFNTGTIFNAFASEAAVLLRGAGANITNSGLILGTRAITALAPDGGLVGARSITNTGQIFGAIDLIGDATDTVVNRGAIDGSVFLGFGDDTFDGRGGLTDDGIFGEEGNDTLTGGNNADILNGGFNDDSLEGGGGNDTLAGGDGIDTTNGGAGNDTHFVDNLDDIVEEDAGEGTADRVATNVTYVLGEGVAVERLTTTAAGGLLSINLTGNTLAQSITGNAGVNVLSDGGGAGVDTLTGLGGNDTYIVRNAATLVNEGAGGGTADRVAAGVSFVLAADDDIEVMTTTSSGGSAAINLTGNALGQAITGNAGANVLDGGAGNDTMTGLGGADDFVFSTALGVANLDQITDFVVGVDDILLQSSVFSAIGAGLTADEFRIGAAVDANDFILYNAATGALTYDSNGNAAAGATQFATLQTGLALTVGDFGII